MTAKGIPLTQSDLSTCVLIVGRPRLLAELVAEALQKEDRRPVIHAHDDRTALELSRVERPGLIIVDFASLPADANALADSLQAMDPNAWILDFAGVVRRRPEHAAVQLALTKPFLLEALQ